MPCCASSLPAYAARRQPIDDSRAGRITPIQAARIRAHSHERHAHVCTHRVTSFAPHPRRALGTEPACVRRTAPLAADVFRPSRALRSTPPPHHVLLVIKTIADTHRAPLDAECLETERRVKRFRRLVFRIHA